MGKRLKRGIMDAQMSHAISAVSQKKMGKTLFWTNFLNEPLFTLYGFVAFILYKDLGASPFQIALFTMLKPAITILSFYWSAGLKGRGGNLKSNVFWAGLWMRIPFLLCPFFDSAWFMIFAAVNYMFFYRAGVPAWMEIIKRNMDEEKRGKLFSLSSGLSYAEGVALALGAGAMLDHAPSLWKVLFMSSAGVGLLSLWVQKKWLAEEMVPPEDREQVILPLREQLIRPWRDSYELLRRRPDFSRFQWGFMVCGFGIMLIQPALPLFVVDYLGISYVEMAGAISIAKGLGFMFSSPFWGRWMGNILLLRMSSWMFCLFGLFPAVLTISVFGIVWFYVAYFFYGVAQGGSHLIWNLSGPLFSGKEDSSRYTGVNVVMAGIRGAVAPPLGSLLLALGAGPIAILIAGGVFCIGTGFAFLRIKEKRAASDYELIRNVE